MILGITGGSGSGKTTLLRILKDAGFTILDCDAIYHELLKTDEGLLCTIDSRFPGCVENGILNRKKLGGIVFADENALLDLNRITHSAVKAEVLRRLANKPALAAIDAIELFDGGLADMCDVTVAITAPEEDRIERLLARDGISYEHAALRIRAQKPEEYFREKCDHVLENTGTQEEFHKKCLAFFKEFIIMK